jgi:hypothetical protein
MTITEWFLHILCTAQIGAQGRVDKRNLLGSAMRVPQALANESLMK